MLTAGSATVDVGDVFAIPVTITNVAGLTSFQFDLAFDPTIITALGFTDIGTDFEAAATSGGGFLTGITGFIDDTTGLLSGIANSISGLVTGNGLTPGGSVVDIEFQALAAGVSPLTLSNAFLTDNGAPLSSDNGDFLLQNGQAAVIGPAPVPEPGTLLLLTLALAFAFWVHRGRRTMKHSIPALAVAATLALGNSPAGAQLFQNGPYYASPSWDQQIPAAQRFVVLSNWGNAAVLDRETGLVWERSPSPELLVWSDALTLCHVLAVGNRLGWRLPSVEELASLVDPTQTPALPAGHPFRNIQDGREQFYWTATQFETDGTFGYVVNFDGRGVAATGKSNSRNRWCVRGSSSVSNPPY